MNPNIIIAAEAAIKAGEAIMAIYESDFSIELKDDKSPLTLADQKANSIINRMLNKTNIPIISEENKEIDYQIRRQWSKVWIVDPLDGTKEFKKRNGEFTVNNALVVNGRPKQGVIYAPVTRTLYIGDVLNMRAVKIVTDGYTAITEDDLDGAQILSSKSNDIDNCRVVGSRSHMNEETTTFIETIKLTGKKVEIISKGSSLKFCIVAEGKADIYPRFAPTMEWDTAAGQAICEAVGISVISKLTGTPMQYNKENLLNPYFLVGNPL